MRGRSSSLRIYSETASYDAVTDARVLRMLAARDVELVLAVRPWDLARLSEDAARIAGAGIALSLWPMLADDDGRFMHVGNVARMRELTLAAVDAAREVPRGGAETAALDVMLDIEPPIEMLRALRRREMRPALAAALRGRRLYQGALRATLSFTRELAARGCTVSTAVAPHALFALEAPLSRLIGTLSASDSERFASLDVMAYTTLFRGYSYGVVDRRRALALLALLSERVAARPSARLALGCIGIGAMGDEITFESPDELAEDVQVARSRGVTRFALLDLGGALARPPLEAWLAAFD